MPDFIALRGDPSDGLPGAPGIGAKTAAELLQRYGSLEAVLESARELASTAALAKRASAGRDGDMRPRTAGVLRENEDLLRTFRHIATLQRIEVERPRTAPRTSPAARCCAREMGMRRLADRLETLAGAAGSDA